MKDSSFAGADLKYQAALKKVRCAAHCCCCLSVSRRPVVRDCLWRMRVSGRACSWRFARSSLGCGHVLLMTCCAQLSVSDATMLNSLNGFFGNYSGFQEVRVIALAGA